MKNTCKNYKIGRTTIVSFFTRVFCMP